MHIQTKTINPSQGAPRFANAENVARMSSIEIAELTGKRHDNVKRDVLAMLADLSVDVLKFEDIYRDGRNREQTQYLLDRQHVDCLLTGYSAPLRMKVIRRWHELEQQAPQIPRTLPEALRMAADLADRNENLQQALIAQEPKMKAISRLAAAGGAICITDAAKQLQMAPCELFAWLAQNRWIYRRDGSTRWIAYQPRITKGLMAHKVTALKPDKETGLERAAFQPLVTPKGLALLAEKVQGGRNGR